MIRSVAPLNHDYLSGLLRQARAGSLEALGRLLESCRNYLLFVARQELRAPLQAKIDAADLVQETFLEAMQDFAHFRGGSEQQLLGWLRGILRHNLTDVTRHFATGCRCLSQEVRLEDRCTDVRGPIASGCGETVCEQLIAREQRRALDTAMQRLPWSYRQVLQLRYSERCSFADIGACLHRSPEAARKLWCRALERLRHDMHVSHET